MSRYHVDKIMRRLIVGFVACTSPPHERAARIAAYQASLKSLGYPDYAT